MFVCVYMYISCACCKMEASLLSSVESSLDAVCLDYLNRTLSSLFADMEIGLLPTPANGGMPVPGGMPAPLVSVNGGGVMMCLASVLEALGDTDERCVFSVRKINKLGFKSHSALKKYFGQFGIVASIYFLPYRYKPDTSSVRPSSMAFVQMTHFSAVENIFADGVVHYIHGWPVTIQAFTRTDVHH